VASIIKRAKGGGAGAALLLAWQRARCGSSVETGPIAAIRAYGDDLRRMGRNWMHCWSAKRVMPSVTPSSRMILNGETARALPRQGRLPASTARSVEVGTDR